MASQTCYTAHICARSWRRDRTYNATDVYTYTQFSTQQGPCRPGHICAQRRDGTTYNTADVYYYIHKSFIRSKARRAKGIVYFGIDLSHVLIDHHKTHTYTSTHAQNNSQ